MTIVTVSYDLSPAEVDSKISTKLVEMGWTPPGKESVQIQLCARIEGLEAERDALAAHVERLIQEIEGALRIKDLWLPSHCEPEHEGECQALGMMHRAFLRVVVETPETSLARQKLLWQAEALEGWLEQMRYMEGGDTQ